MTRVVLDGPGAVAERAAREIAAAIAGGVRSIALAGGTTPLHAYAALRALPVEWGRVTVLFGDERCVAPDSGASNYAMARAALLDHVAPASVHRIAGELGAEPAANAYDAVVASLQPLDLVLLGVGEDGHTASLFPGSPALSAPGWVAPVHGAPKPPPDRVTLTLAALRGARRVIVLATGAGKAAAVDRAGRAEVPAGMVPGAEWILDAAAAGGGR